MNARSPYWSALLVGIGLTMGLWGLRWGLPSRERLDRVMPPGLDTPEFRGELMESWSKMHAKFGSNVDIMLSPESFSSGIDGVQDAVHGWTKPPLLLENSMRSFYLRSAHEDEQTFFILLSRMRPWRLQLNPRLFIYGGAYIYSLGAWLALGAVLHIAPLHTSLAPYMADVSQMASLYFVGRLFTVATYIACALMLLRIGRRHLSAEAGIIGALFFLLSPGVIVQAHVQKPNTLWPFFTLWALDLTLDVLASGGTAAYAFAGAIAGLAVGTSLTAWPSCVVIGFACALRMWLLRKPAATELKGLIVACVTSIAAFFATNPYWILDWTTVHAEMKMVAGGVDTFNLTHPALFFSLCAEAVTRPVMALIAIGSAGALIKGRRKPALWLCLFTVLAGLAMMSIFRSVISVRQDRHYLGFLAVGQLLAGWAAAELIKTKSGPWLRAALVAVLANVALTGAAYSYNFHEDAGDRSTHVESGAWIEAHLPPGSTIGMLRLPQPSCSPYFRYDRYDLRFIDGAGPFAALPADKLPEYLTVTSADVDDRPLMGVNLSRYELAASFDRSRLFPWIEINPTATTADPLIEIYRLKRIPF